MNIAIRNQFIMYGALVLMVLANIFVNTFKLNGFTTGEIANLYTVYFMPAGYTFMIWTVIYVGLLIWCLMFTLKRHVLTDKILWVFVVSCGLNILWLIFWHFTFPGLAAIILGFHLLSVCYLYLLVRKSSERHWFNYAISIYFAWLIIAFTVNLLYYLVATVRVEAVVQLSYTYLALCILVITALVLFLINKDWLIQFTFAWGFIGISFGANHESWILSLIIGILTAGILIVDYLIYQKRLKKEDVLE